MVTLQFWQNKKSRNTVNTASPSGSTTQALFKDDTSIVRPTFRMHLNFKGMSSSAELMQNNYVWCPELNRYYWITNIVAITAVIFDIYCETDVLTTFYADIVSTKAFVTHAESRHNSMIPDARIPRTLVSQMESKSTTIADLSLNGCFAIQVATTTPSGKTGVINTFLLETSELLTLAGKLYSPDFIEKITDSFSSPSEALISCTWIPVYKGRSTDGSAVMNFNDVDLGSASLAARTLSDTLEIVPYVPHKSQHRNPTTGALETNWADYRNCTPFTEYSMWLPGAGIVNIPMAELIGDGSTQPRFAVEYIISVPTGDIVYYINRFNDASEPNKVGSAIMSVTGKLGVQVPVSTFQSGATHGIMSAISAVAAIGVTAMVPNALPFMLGSMASSAASAVFNIPKSSLTASGNMGTWALTDDTVKAICYTTYYDTSDEPMNCEHTIGLPLYKTLRLGDLAGYVLCEGAFVETWGTAEELDMISNYLNGRGVIIEQAT